jgi:recombination protein RecR
MHVAHTHVKVCSACGNIDTCDPCTVCKDYKRDPSTLIVVEDVADLWALERSQALNARYHVLGGVMSALDGVRIEDLNIIPLINRLKNSDEIKEVILALSATVDGQTTAHYIMDMLKETGLKISRLAHGVPVGGELDYLDDGTLATALKQRIAY